MSLVLVRIDDRLIHGQVVVGWVPTVRAEQIVVANDRLAKDDSLRNMMSIAVEEINALFFTLKEAASAIKQGQLEPQRTILLLESPRDALFLVQEGVSLTTINLGPMKFMPGKRQLLPSIYLGEEDIDALNQLSHKGIELEARLVPSDKGINPLSRWAEEGRN